MKKNKIIAIILIIIIVIAVVAALLIFAPQIFGDIGLPPTPFGTGEGAGVPSLPF